MSSQRFAHLALAGPAWSQEVTDPRQDLFYANPGLRALMDWVTLRFTFDADRLVPEMAAGEFAPQWGKTARFGPGLRGQALLAGAGSAAELFARGPNAALGTRGALSLGYARWTGSMTTAATPPW